jgi:NhaA family Na+:H+ antiporter
VIVPLFALGNAGISLSPESLTGAASSSVAWGVLVGLLVGKPIGILLFSGLAVRLGFASLPDGATWRAIAGAGLLAGIGFTVSVFIADLALDQPVVNESKVAILTASIAAGILGMVLLRRSPNSDV